MNIIALYLDYSNVKILSKQQKRMLSTSEHNGRRSLSPAGHAAPGCGFGSRSAKFRLTNGFGALHLLLKYRFLHYSFVKASFKTSDSVIDYLFYSWVFKMCPLRYTYSPKKPIINMRMFLTSVKQADQVNLPTLSKFFFFFEN